MNTIVFLFLASLFILIISIALFFFRRCLTCPSCEPSCEECCVDTCKVFPKCDECIECPCDTPQVHKLRNDHLMNELDQMLRDDTELTSEFANSNDFDTRYRELVLKESQNIGFDDKQWYTVRLGDPKTFLPTCIAKGSASTPCDSSKFVCVGGDTFGTTREQLDAIIQQFDGETAPNNPNIGFVHPDCPQ